MYDGPVGLLGIRSGEPVRVDQLHEAAVVALALRERRARRQTPIGCSRASHLPNRTVYRQGAIPFTLDADVAAIWAVQGRRDQALAMLDRAMRRGWTDSGNTDLSDIDDEPAFRSLHGEPRFVRLRARLAEHLARERAETLQLKI